MSEHERSIVINTPPEQAFRFLSSVSSLPTFLPWLRSIREDPRGDEVFGVAEFNGERQEISGFYRVSRTAKRIDWGSDGTPEYRGWLEIKPEANGKSCKLTAHISTGTDKELRPGFTPQRIESLFDQVMNSIKHQLEVQHAGELVGQERIQ